MSYLETEQSFQNGGSIIYLGKDAGPGSILGIVLITEIFLLSALHSSTVDLVGSFIKKFKWRENVNPIQIQR